MSGPLMLADRVAETAVNISNVSPIPLLGAVDARHDTFVGALGAGVALVPYVAVHRTSGQWEYGYGTLATGPDSITRAVIKRNSAHTLVPINFSAGTVDVFLDIGAEDLPTLDADDRGITFVDYNASPSFEHTLFGARGTKAAPTAVQSGDTLGRYGFGGYGATAFSNRSKAAMRGSAAENWSDTAQGADLIFATTPKTTTTLTDRVWLSSEGALSVGAVYGSGGASQPLQVHATVGPLWLMRSSNNAAGANLSIVKSRGATAGSLAALVAGDAISILNFLGVAGDGSTVASAAQISVDIPTSGVATTTLAGQITFLTTNLAGSQAIRLKLSSEGVITPGVDNTYALGTGALRWSDFQSYTATISSVLSVGSAPGQFNATTQPFQVAVGASALAYLSRSSNDAGGVRVQMVKSRNGSIGGKTKVVDADILSEFSTYGIADDNSTVSQATDYYIRVPVGGVPAGQTYISGDHIWQTRNLAGTNADRMWLSSEGVLALGATYGFAGTNATMQTSDVGVVSVQHARFGADGTGIQFVARKSRGGTAGSLAAVVAGDTLFQMIFSGVAGDNSTHSTAAGYLINVASGGVATTKVSGEHQWTTTNLAGTGAVRLWLTSEGVLKPFADNSYALGTGALRWSDFQSVTGTFGGLVTFNATGNAWVVSAALARTAMTSTTGTNASYHGMTNTGGSGYVGLESSVGGGIFTGSSAYSLVLYTSATQDIQLIRGGVLGLTVGASGAITMPGTLTVTGATIVKPSLFVGGGTGSAPGVGTSGVQTWYSSNQSFVTFVLSGNSADARIAEFQYVGTTMRGRFVNDAYSGATNWLVVTGTSASITSIEFTGNTTFDNNVSCAGNIVSTVGSTGTAFQMVSGARFYLDGGGDTYLLEGAANTIRFFAGAAAIVDIGTTYLAMYSGLEIDFNNSANDNAASIKNPGGAGSTQLRITASTLTASADFVAVGAFGCNSKAAQSAFASGGALAAYGAGANGFDTAGHASALYAMVVALRAALVANGIMS